MNIKEVAQEAGVSVATISRVLNGSEKVNPKTRQKVTKIIKKMNYFPNVNAKVLRENRSKIILICVPDITNIIYSLITKGVLEYLKEKGYNGMIHISYGRYNHRNEDIKEYISLFETKKIDGIIFITSSISEENYKKLNEKYNVMVRSEYFEDSVLETVGVNQRKAMYFLVKYLFEKKNVKKAMYYTWKIPTGTSRERLKGYLDYMEEKGKKDSRQNYKQIDFRELGNFSEELKQDLENDEEIEAVILNSDFYAIYTEKLLKRFKRRIYVASFDGTQLLDMVSDKIVHIKQPFQEMGKISAELLIKKMNGEDYEKKVYLDYELIDKGDCLKKKT